MTLALINDVGRQIDDEFRGSAFEPSALGDVASQLLAESNLAEVFDYRAFALDVAHVDILPKQRHPNPGFGQPPMTLYNGPDDGYFIEIYLHSRPDMSVHDHSFTGAFIVLHGSCDHQVFEYHSEDDGELSAGELRPQYREPLEPGAVRTIRSGRSLIHRNLHLDRPTVTLVIRTVWDGMRQHSYHAPGLALDNAMTGTASKQAQLFEGLLRVDSGAATTYLRELLTSGAPGTLLYRCLDLYFRLTHDWSRAEEYVALAKDTFGQREAAVCAALALAAQETISERPTHVWQ